MAVAKLCGANSIYAVGQFAAEVLACGAHGRRSAHRPAVIFCRARDVRRRGQDLSLLPGARLGGSAGAVFVGDEVVLEVGFDAAAAALAKLARSGLLAGASGDAYEEGITGVVPVGPLGSVPGLSRLVEVHALDLVRRPDSAVLVLRWQALGPGGGLFPSWTPTSRSRLPASTPRCSRSPACTGRRWGSSAPRWTGRSCTGLPPQRSGPSSPGSRTPSPIRRARPNPKRAAQRRIRPGRRPRPRRDSRPARRDQPPACH